MFFFNFRLARSLMLPVIEHQARQIVAAKSITFQGGIRNRDYSRKILADDTERWYPKTSRFR
jgi:hypothetical protein